MKGIYLNLVMIILLELRSCCESYQFGIRVVCKLQKFYGQHSTVELSDDEYSIGWNSRLRVTLRRSYEPFEDLFVSIISTKENLSMTFSSHYGCHLGITLSSTRRSDTNAILNSCVLWINCIEGSNSSTWYKQRNIENFTQFLVNFKSFSMHSYTLKISCLQTHFYLTVHWQCVCGHSYVAS